MDQPRYRFEITGTVCDAGSPLINYYALTFANYKLFNMCNSFCDLFVSRYMISVLIRRSANSDRVSLASSAWIFYLVHLNTANLVCKIVVMRVLACRGCSCSVRFNYSSIWTDHDKLFWRRTEDSLNYRTNHMLPSTFQKYSWIAIVWRVSTLFKVLLGIMSFSTCGSNS